MCWGILYISPRNHCCNIMRGAKLFLSNRPLIFSGLLGLNYLLLAGLANLSEFFAELNPVLMIAMPGFAFPLATSYHLSKESSFSALQGVMHLLLSVGIFIFCINIFVSRSLTYYGPFLAGATGSSLFLLISVWVLEKRIPLWTILVAASLSGIAVAICGSFSLGISQVNTGIFLWTIINGVVMNATYRREWHIWHGQAVDMLA